MTLLSTSGLRKRYGGLTAVDGVDFTLEAGEIRALIGPNGAGKTTFVSLVSGRILPDEGRVIFDGQDVTRWPAHRRMAAGMAYTFQITSIFGNLTLFENVALAVQRRLDGDRVAITTETMTVLSRVGLAERAEEIAGDLAYGHQRLLEIAMGVGQNPRLLILDEPTQGLAEAEIAAFREIVRDVVKTATVLLIEHNMDVVMALADRITVLDMGQVLAEGTPEEIHANDAVQRAYLGRR